MTPKTFFTTSACSLLLATAAVAQSDRQPMTEEEMTSAGEAADTMFVEVYGANVPEYVTVSDTIQRLQEMGYTNIHDFDVEWGVYEVEADAPNGNEVEVEIDPVSGAILEIEDNWF